MKNVERVTLKRLFRFLVIGVLYTVTLINYCDVYLKRGGSALMYTVEALGVEGDNEPFFPLDPQFSENSCIVIAPYADVDCSLAPPDRFLLEDENNPCPGCPEEDDGQSELAEAFSLNGQSQVLFDSIENAIDYCPFDPALIEFTGTLYLSNEEFFYYNGTRNITIRGISEFIDVPGTNISQLVPMNVTYFNATLNMTVTEEQLVEVFQVTEGSTEELRAVLVGFKDWQVAAQNISITMENLVLEGCDTERPVFLTEVKPERCEIPEPPPLCCGEYFLTEDYTSVREMGLCQRTAALFDKQVHYNSDCTFVSSSQPDSCRFQEEFTLEMWVKPSVRLQNTYSGIAGTLSTDDDDDNSGYGIVWRNPDDLSKQEILDDPALQSGAVWFLVAQNGDFGPKPLAPAPVNQWTHLAGVFDNGQMSLYVNGDLYANATRNGADVDYPVMEQFRVGAVDVAGNVRRFNGSIDELRLWGKARTQSQIQSLLYETVDPDTAVSEDLRIYMRFDKPQGAAEEAGIDTFAENLMYLRNTSLTALDVYQGGPGIDPPKPIPVCFCTRQLDEEGGGDPEYGTCTASNLMLSAPSEAIIEEFGEFCEEPLEEEDEPSCQFLHGTIIDPNGDFGLLWLPGLKNTSVNTQLTGTSSDNVSFDPVERFIPGQFFVIEEFMEMMVFNATTNMTETVQVSTGVVSVEFIPGAVASSLPPLDDGSNPFSASVFQDRFIPGWFLNDGLPPYTGMNFFPGIFVPLDEAQGTYGVPEPDGYRGEGDMVFVPGVYFFDSDDTYSSSGEFFAYSMGNPFYVIPIADRGGITFNLTLDTDNCTVPPIPLEMMQDGSMMPMGPIENQFGCTVGPDDPEPYVLDPSQRDPCFVLRDIRRTLPLGTEVLEPEEVLGCAVGPDDPEPYVLDPSQRDPCFILRDLREQLVDTVDNCTLSGGELLEPLYVPCLKNQNLTMIDVAVQNYRGDRVVCMFACDEYVTLMMEDSDFVNTPGTALWASGLHDYDVNNNNYCPCGGQTEECVYLNANHITRGEFIFYNNRHCAIEPTLPTLCDYDLTPTLRCLNGELLCLNVTETILQDCQEVEIAPGVLVFDTDCSVYSPCQCEGTPVNITLPNGQQFESTVPSGNIQVEIPFLTPPLEEVLLDGGIVVGENETLFYTIECPLENVTIPIMYTCEEEVEFNVTVMNMTVTMTMTVETNCTYLFNVSQSVSGNIPCDCPEGFNSSLAVNVTGSQANGQLGTYDNCMWDLPGGNPGEMCVDGILYCPFEGGSIGGDASPPPPEPGECFEGTATVECNNSTCIGGLLYYEGVYHPCNLTDCATNAGYLSVPCMCEDNSLLVECVRNVTCFPTMTACNATTDPLCEILDGILMFDGVSYPCLISQNQTLCNGTSSAPADLTDPADGFLRLPCDNSYSLPPPGPCSCLEVTDLSAGNSTLNVTIPTQAQMCNFTLDPNCTETLSQQIDTGDEALQLECLPSGQISCRCDGFQALNSSFSDMNITLLNTSTAFHIDHVPVEASQVYIQGNIAEQLPYGMRIQRFTWDVVKKFALKVLHFFSAEGVIHELSRLSPLITGTVHDWVHGHDDQWNRRTCDNGCHQPRPRQLLEACVVDSTYADHVPLFDSVRFNRIQRAINKCEFRAVVIHKADNVYEERVIFDRANFWVGSYDGAVIVKEGQNPRNDNITLRGLTIVHTGTSSRPLIQPAADGDEFDSSDDDDGVDPPSNFTVLNCNLYGNGVNDAGAVVGQLGNFFVFSYNTVRDFLTRAVDIGSTSVEVVLNTFELNTGISFRGREMKRYRFEENLFKECTGVISADDMDMVVMKAFGDLGSIEPSGFSEFLFEVFFGDPQEKKKKYKQFFKEPEVDPDMGCNPLFDESRQCYFRGNRQMVSDEQLDFSNVAYRFEGGNMTTDRIVDNVAYHALYGMYCAYTPSLKFEHASELFVNNPLIRVQDSRMVDADLSNDFEFKEPGSPVSVGCRFPECYTIPDGQQYPVLEVNPRCDLTLVESYGLLCMNNMTAANRYGLPLNLLNVTSERARLRREDIFFALNMYAVGYEDYACCDKPVFYGSDHLIAAQRTILDNIEFRYEFDLELDGDGNNLFLTLPGLEVQEIRFLRLCMDGRYTVGTERTSITELFLDVVEGVFVMDSCLVYDWWHYPDGTVRGYVDGEKGIVPLVIEPNGMIYKTDNSPNMDGIYVHFTTFERLDDVPIYFDPDNPRDRTLIDSVAIVTNNYLENLDGTGIVIHTPAGWQFLGNVCYNCGMRQFEETAVFMLEGNQYSTGFYECEDNVVNQTKPYLFPIGGGQGNRVNFAAYHLFSFGSPTVWTYRNNTATVHYVGENGELFLFSNLSNMPPSLSSDKDYYEDEEESPASVDPVQGGPFDGVTLDPDDVEGPTFTAEDIVGTSTDIDRLLGVGGTAGPEEFREREVVIFSQDQRVVGCTEGLRLSTIQDSTILMTVTPGSNLNATLLPFLQPDLFALRVLASEQNAPDPYELLASGVIEDISQLPTNGIGVQGIKNDIVLCEGYKDILEDAFSQCTICDDGCPVVLPDRCVVDPANDTFVPQNPLFGRWFFVDVNLAVLECRDPNGLIELRSQGIGGAFHQLFDVDVGNVTLFSNDGAVIDLSSQPFLVNADDVTLEGVTLVHKLGNDIPTLSSGNKLGRPVRRFTLNNVTFEGRETRAHAVLGEFESISVQQSSFFDYRGDRVVELFSECGELFFEDNLMRDARGSALYASEFSILVVRNNEFDLCGGRREDELSCVYVSSCEQRAFVESIVFEFNEHVQDEDEVRFMVTGQSPNRGYVSAYWLDGLPFLDRPETEIALTNNRASGLSIGMRITRADDIFNSNQTSSLSMNKRATVQQVAVSGRNIHLEGTWHCVVWGEPSEDKDLEDEPNANFHRYCDKDCSDASQNASLVITLTVFTLIAFAWITYTCLFRIKPRYDPPIIVSNVTGDVLPSDPSKWGESSKRQAEMRIAENDGELLPNNRDVRRLMRESGVTRENFEVPTGFNKASQPLRVGTIFRNRGYIHHN